MSIHETTGVTMPSEQHKDSMKVPPLNEMFLLNAWCEKSRAEEVQFYFKCYQEFITSDNQKLIAVISTLNATNVGHYNDLRIKYPGFLLEPQVVDSNKLVSVIQSVYPTQVLQYSLGDKMKEKPTTSHTAVSEDVNSAGLFKKYTLRILDRKMKINQMSI